MLPLGGGGELVALKDHLVDGWLGNRGPGHPVEHHITHCNLSVHAGRSSRMRFINLHCYGTRISNDHRLAG